MSDVIDHDEAYQLACMKRGESNLARCYIDMRADLQRKENTIKSLQHQLDPATPVRINFCVGGVVVETHESPALYRGDSLNLEISRLIDRWPFTTKSAQPAVDPLLRDMLCEPQPGQARSPLGNITHMAVGEDTSAPAPSMLHHQCADAELGRRIRATIIEKPDGWTVPEQHFNGAPSLETIDDVLAISAQVKP